MKIPIYRAKFKIKWVITEEQILKWSMARAHHCMSRFVVLQLYAEIFVLTLLGRDYTDSVNFSEGICDPNKVKILKKDSD